MNWALEFHDSEIIAIHKIGTQLFLFLGAYLHASEGVIGKDQGAGYVQAVCFCFENGTTQGAVEVWPADIYESRFVIDQPGWNPYGLLSLPAAFQCDVSLNVILGARGEELTFAGSGLTITRLGEPHFVEQSRVSGTPCSS